MSEMGKSNEMIERVAQAIDAAYAPSDLDWNKCALAAIAAMREPTLAMTRAGYETNAAEFNPAFADEQAATIWQSMINAALAEGQSK